MLRNTPVDMYALSAALSKEQCIPLKIKEKHDAEVKFGEKRGLGQGVVWMLRSVLHKMWLMQVCQSLLQAG